MTNPLKKRHLLLPVSIFFTFSLVSLLMHNGQFYIFSNQNYNEWRIIEVFGICLINLYLVFYHKRFFHYLKHPFILYILFAFFIIFGLISSVSKAEYLSRALRDWSLYSSFLIAIIGLSILIYHHPKLAKLTLTIMCCAPVFFIINFLYQIIFYFTVPIDPHPSVLLTWQAQFSHDRIFGDTILPIVFMLAALITITENLRFRRFLIGLCIAESIMLMFSGGRGILISLLISIVFTILINKKARKLLLYFLINLVCAFIIGLLLVHILSGDLDRGTIFRADSSGRVAIINEVLNNFIHNPILGIGPAQSQFPQAGTTLSHPHNLFLQILSEWGVIAFIAFVTLLSIAFFRLTLLVRRESNAFNIFMFTGSIAFLINCNFNGAHVYSSSQIYGLFIFSWLLSIYAAPQITTEANPKNFAITYVIPCIVLTINMVLVSTTYLVLGCAGSNAPAEAWYGGPRFWLADAPHDDSICKPLSTTDSSLK